MDLVEREVGLGTGFDAVRVVLVPDGFLGSTLSCTLRAELAVGRIMRAKKPSSTGLLLVRELGRSFATEARAEGLRVVEDVELLVRDWTGGLRVGPLVPDLAALVPDLAVEDKLGVVADDGRRADLVAFVAGIEARGGRVVGLDAVFRAARLGLRAGSLAVAPAAGFAERTGFAEFSGLVAMLLATVFGFTGEGLGAGAGGAFSFGVAVAVFAGAGVGGLFSFAVGEASLVTRIGDCSDLTGSSGFGEVLALEVASMPLPGGVDARGVFTGPSISSELKLRMRTGAAGLSLRVLALLRRLETGLDCTAPSTAIKLARTLDKGLVEPGVSEPTGDLPREGGEVVLACWVSNLASRLRTPGWPPVSMAVTQCISQAG